MRYFFEISYHGAPFAGWQRQPNAVGVQAVVEDSLSKLLREPIEIVGSGRTDTGVHCEQQFFHADIAQAIDVGQLRHKLNAFLPSGIAIHHIFPVADNAHARYDATARSYQYRITTEKDPFADGLAWFFFKDLDVRTMNEAAALIVGEHDFGCFSKVNTDVNHFLCTIHHAAWQEQGHRLMFDITANRFLRGMVRAIVGTLIDVGTGKTSLEQFRDILASRDRRRAGANAPPHGLYLVKVVYPATITKPTA